MPRRVFFSFHYKIDPVRVGQVRNSSVVRSNSVETSDFIDAAKWEAVQKQGEQAIKNWIAAQLNGTSVTVVLIGAETAKRRWIKYEIDESLKRGNGLLASIFTTAHCLMVPATGKESAHLTTSY
jgi:hypothetical protein